MRLVISKMSLVPALGLVTGVVERKQTLPILGHVLLSHENGVVTVRGTDLELELQTSCVGAKGQSGTTTLPARKFFEICRSLGDDAEIAIKIEHERALISSGRSRFTLATLPADCFPAMQLADAEYRFDLPADSLRSLLEKTGFAMAQQDVRYYLNGVMLELSAGSVVGVATDGHRLAKFVATLAAPLAEAEGLHQFILPAKAVTELKRLTAGASGAVRVDLGQRIARFCIGDTVLTSKLVEGRYPEYERVIPRNLEQRALIPREVLRSALQRTAILSSEKYKGVRVTFEPGNLGLAVQNQEKEEAEDSVGIDYAGPITTIGFNVGYILDVLGAIETADVEVFFRDGESSSIWQGSGSKDETFVIMPMRL